jgi:quinol monooxygenase YgiN
MSEQLTTPATDAAITTGLLKRFDATHGKEDNVAALLKSAMSMLPDEPATLAWYGLKLGRHEFRVFDAFADEAGREAHLDGAISKALLGARSLLDTAPAVEKVRVLAHKKPMTSTPAHKGLLLSFPARAGHEAEVEQFLRDALPMVEDEPGTLAWFAIQRDNGDYGIFDVFPDNGARFAHLTGHVPRGLARHLNRLLGGVPDLHLLEVIAERPH